MTCGISELSCGLYTSDRIDISPGNFHLYRPLANDIGQLLGYISPFTNGISGPGASKGTPGDAKCVTEILVGGGGKIRKLGGGQSLNLVS